MQAPKLAPRLFQASTQSGILQPTVAAVTFSTPLFILSWVGVIPVWMAVLALWAIGCLSAVVLSERIR